MSGSRITDDDENKSRTVIGTFFSVPRTGDRRKPDSLPPEKRFVYDTFIMARDTFFEYSKMARDRLTRQGVDKKNLDATLYGSDEYNRLQIRYEDALVDALRNRLANVGDVAEHVTNLRLFQDWDVLRRARRGLEKGTSRPNAQDAWLLCEAGDLVDQGASLREVQCCLLARIAKPDYTPPPVITEEDLPQIVERLQKSRQNFHVWMKRVGLRTDPTASTVK